MKVGTIDGLTIAQIKEIRQNIKTQYDNNSHLNPFLPSNPTLYGYTIAQFSLLFMLRKKLGRNK